VHALCIEVDGLRIVVDTCIGNDMDYGSSPYLQIFNGLHTSFLDDMTAAGFGPDDVDVVICTHLHPDHVGWNTRRVDGQWLPTFPNARYLMSRVDVDHWRHVEGAHNPFETSVQPLIEHGLLDAVETDHRVTAGVSLMPTPGHTPGHFSVGLESSGEVAVITGDMVHSPVQLVRPEWTYIYDMDRVEAARSCRRLLELVGDTGVLVLGTHFPRPTAGRVVSDGATWRFV
jgi:glyoxylase-like metal-dependent hydrolase (beta-lactamase superfamily II)